MAIDAAANKPSLWTPLPTSPVHSSSLSPDDQKKEGVGGGRREASGIYDAVAHVEDVQTLEIAKSPMNENWMAILT